MAADPGHAHCQVNEVGARRLAVISSRRESQYRAPQSPHIMPARSSVSIWATSVQRPCSARIWGSSPRMPPPSAAVAASYSTSPSLPARAAGAFTSSPASRRCAGRVTSRVTHTPLTIKAHNRAGGYPLGSSWRGRLADADHEGYFPALPPAELGGGEQPGDAGALARAGPAQARRGPVLQPRQQVQAGGLRAGRPHAPRKLPGRCPPRPTGPAL